MAATVNEPISPKEKKQDQQANGEECWPDAGTIDLGYKHQVQPLAESTWPFHRGTVRPLAYGGRHACNHGSSRIQASDGGLSKGKESVDNVFLSQNGVAY